MTHFEKIFKQYSAKCFLKAMTIYVGVIEMFGKASRKLSEIIYYGIARRELSEIPFPNAVQVIPKLADIGYKTSDKCFKIFESSNAYAKRLIKSNSIEQMED